MHARTLLALAAMTLGAGCGGDLAGGAEDLAVARDLGPGLPEGGMPRLRR